MSMSDGGDTAPVAPRAHCTNCGNPVEPGAVACLSCGFRPTTGTKFCRGCGSALTPGQVVCVQCGIAVLPDVAAPSGYAPPSSDKNKVTAGLLALFLGGLGIHKFYLGYTNAGWVMLGVSLGGICLGALLIFPILGSFAIGIIAFIEAIIYFTKSDADFHETYVANTKEWF